MNLSLRNRIAFFYMTATAVMTLIFFIIIYGVVHSTLYNHLNEDLDNESIEIKSSFSIEQDTILIKSDYEWLEKEHTMGETNQIYAEVVDIKGHIIRKSENLLDGNLNFSSALNENIYFNAEFAGKPIRQVQYPLLNSNGKISGYLMLGEPIEEASMVMDNLARVLILGFPIVLVVLFFVTRAIAEKSILPLNTVIRTTEKITKENLYQRIPLPQNKDEIYQLATTTNGLLDRLEDAVLREKQFTSDASHELRNPLAVIKGTLEVLIRKPRDIEYYENKISYCIKEVNRISGIIDQLLMLARYESANIEPLTTQVDLNESIQYTILRLQDYATDHGVKISFDENSKYTVKADASMLNIILENLLSNAIKYSNLGKKIDIKIEQRDTCTKCSITDYGIGMSKEEITRIFDRFYRSEEARNSKIGGHGIGLAIVKRLADVQNINIQFTSKPSKGTTATITFNCE